MVKQQSLFDLDETPSPSNTMPVLTKSDLAQLSAGQRQLNKLLQSVESLTGELQDLNAYLDDYRLRRAQILPPLENSYRDLERQLINFLNESLEQKALTAKQRQTARDMVLGMAEGYARNGDATMQAIFEALSPVSMRELDRAQAENLHGMFKEMFGVELGDTDDMESPEEVLQAAHARLQAEARAKAEKRARRKEKRAPTVKQIRQEQEALEANTALRSIYRQLASALHPDREQDPHEQARKHALMSEVNTAYERKELSTLLRLQLQTERITPETLSSLADEKVASFVRLLKDQANALRRDLEQQIVSAIHEFGLHSPLHVRGITPAMLERDLKEKESRLRKDIGDLSFDLNQIQDIKQLKKWLSEQSRLLKAAERRHAHEDLSWLYR